MSRKFGYAVTVLTIGLGITLILGTVGGGAAIAHKGIPLGISGYEQVSSPSAHLQPGEEQLLTLPCPSGKVPLGGGYQATLGIRVIESYPDGSVWRIRASNVGSTQNEAIIPFATCATAPSP